MRTFAVSGCILVASVLCLPQPVSAQVGGDLSIGYTFLSNDTLAVNSDNLPAGWYFDSSYRVNEFFSIATNIAGHYKRGIQPSDSRSSVVPPLATEDFQAFSFNRPETEFCSPVLTVCDVGIQTIGAVIGPRIHFQAGGATAFVHGLAGVSRSLRKIGFFAHTATHFAIQPGGGVDLNMTDNTAFRVQVDYRVTFFPEPDQTDPKASLVSVGGENYKDVSFSLGVVVKLGSARN